MASPLPTTSEIDRISTAFNRSRDDIQADLRKSGSVNHTVNRILDGNFLESVRSVLGNSSPARPTPTVINLISSSDSGENPVSKPAAASRGLALGEKSPERTQSLKPKRASPLWFSLEDLEPASTNIPDPRLNSVNKPVTDTLAGSCPENQKKKSYSKFLIDSDDESEDDAATKHRPRFNYSMAAAYSLAPAAAHTSSQGGMGSSRGSNLNSISAAQSSSKPTKGTKRLNTDDDGATTASNTITKKTAKEKSAKDKEKAEKKRIAEKDRAEKRDMKQANKIRSKTLSMGELIIEFDRFFAEGGLKRSLEIVKELGGDCACKSHVIPQTVLFVRKVTRRWNEQSRCWFPCPETREYDPFVLVFLESQDFVDRLQSRELRNLLTNLKNSYPGYTIILLIEGMEKYYRNLKKDVNKQFQAAMRRVSGGANSSSFDATTERPDQAFIENVIMQLQFDQDVRVQFSKDSADSSEWIGNICKEVAVIPEQSRRSNQAFNLTFGDKPASGKNLPDTWKKMLLEYFGVSGDKAEAISLVYPTIDALYRAYAECDNRDRVNMLHGIAVKSSTKNKITKIGPAISRRVYENFWLEDPNELMKK